jgi:acetyltransferase-like isoleucine patch superfamily enzyme
LSPREIHPTTVLELESEILGRVIVDGVNCRIRVGANVRMTAQILIHNEVSGATIEIADHCVLDGIIRLVRGEGGAIRIGPRTTFNQVGLSMHEASQITFGSDCMLSTDIHMDPSDMHPIFDRITGERLNPPQPIEVGDHVWLGARVLVLKGARIGSGTVVGAGSMVAGVLPPNVLAVGSPAKVVRENIVWTRDMDETPQLVAPNSPRRGPWPWGGKS